MWACLLSNFHLTSPETYGRPKRLCDKSYWDRENNDKRNTEEYKKPDRKFIPGGLISQVY